MGQKEEINSKYHGNEKDHVSWPWLLIMKTKAYFYIISAAALWGLIGLFVKHLASLGFTSIQIVALRSISSAICAVLALAPSVKALFKIDWRDAWMFVGTGVISLTFFNYCYFNCIAASSLAVAGLLYVDPGQASILATIEPFVAAVIGICYFQEPLTTQKLVGMGLIFAAIILLNLPVRNLKLTK